MLAKSMFAESVFAESVFTKSTSPKSPFLNQRSRVQNSGDVQRGCEPKLCD